MRRFLLFLALIAACKKEPEPEPGPPRFDQIRRVVTVGDNVASNPSWSTSYVALLAQNDDAIFPDFAGADLATALPEAELIRLDRGGDSYYAVADAGDAVRTCPATPACLDPDDDRPTLVIVELGVNDLVATALAMVSDPAERERVEERTAAFRDDVADVLAQVTDPAVFPRPPKVVVTNLVDPSDGVGDVAELITTFFPFEGADQVTHELALSVIGGFNHAIEAEAVAIGADVVDLHGAFLGHAWHFDDEASPHHDAADETFWFRTVVDPNLRGAHEIRRELWAALTDERIDAIPTDLPLDQTLGLPAVPDDGWAVAVIDSVVTPELVDDAGTVFTNVAADVNAMIGPPDAGTFSGTVALGVVGAYAVVELGAPAMDGEGDDLVVIEFGAASGGVPEPYRVSVSTDPTGPWTVLADAFGERSFDLGSAGASGIRYVLVESLAQRAEVLGGVGSPYYPGGEFDAVGAVYPGN